MPKFEEHFFLPLKVHYPYFRFIYCTPSFIDRVLGQLHFTWKQECNHWATVQCFFLRNSGRTVLTSTSLQVRFTTKNILGISEWGAWLANLFKLLVIPNPIKPGDLIISHPWLSIKFPSLVRSFTFVLKKKKLENTNIYTLTEICKNKKKLDE